MRRPDERQLRAMRTLLAEARVENARMVAAAIGGHLSRISREGGEHRDVTEASDVVRDASLDLLTTLHRGDDAKSARMAAIKSVETLQAALPDPASLTPIVPRPISAARGTGRSDIIRRLAGKKLSAVLPSWRG